MTTFVLVHGAGHGAWCWDRLVTSLASRGHDAIAIDLPCENPTATFSDYADVVDEAIHGSDTVLVGHSLAGLTIPLVAARRRLRRLVFLCAELPTLDAIPFRRESDAPPSTDPGLVLEDHADGSFSFSAASARTHLYNRCTSADADSAIARLRRQSRTPNREKCPIAKWPVTPRVYVACREDRIVKPDYGRYIALKRGDGMPVVELDGDHSPFLSAPEDLADLLVSLSRSG